MNKEDLDVLGNEVGLPISESKGAFMASFTSTLLRLMQR